MEAKRVCGAKTKSGGRCQRRDLGTGKRCRLHGGASPAAGRLHPNFRSGKYSAFVPRGVAESYKAAASDPELIELRDALVLVETELLEKLRLLDLDGSVGLWQQLREAADELGACLRTRNVAQFVETASKIKALIERGCRHFEAWQDIRELLNSKRKFVESERRWMLANQQMVPLDKLFVLIDALAQSVRANVTDEDVLRRIGADIARLVGRPGPLEATAADPAAG